MSDHLSDTNRTECNRCVMDISDPNIEFDKLGQCNHCRNAEVLLLDARTKYSSERLEKLFERIKLRNVNKEHDGIIGLSGGLDSAYVLTLAIEHGLRPLVVHVDAGWNSDTSSSNIHAIVDYYDLKLHTVVIEWEEMRRLQLAYLNSGLMNQDVPQDHAFFASLYKVAAQNGISDVITGENITTESILPRSWGYGAMDGRQVKEIARRFDTGSFESYPFLTIPRFYMANFVARRLQIHKPLVQFEYSKVEALKKLSELIDWKPYVGKHGESTFTTFYQSVYLPRRFGIDKRRAHLSSLIVSEQISRSSALETLNQMPSDEIEQRNMVAYVARKLEISIDKLETYMQMSAVSHHDFPNHDYIIRLANSNTSSLFKKLIRN